MGEPPGGKTRQELNIDDKVEQPAAGKDDRVFDERHGTPPLDRTAVDPSQDYGENGAVSEKLKIFPVFPIGHR